MKKLLILCITALSSIAIAQDIIPKPAQIQEQVGEFKLNSNTKVYSKDFGKSASFVKHLYSLKSASKPGLNTVILKKARIGNDLGKEGYTLQVSNKGILITANTEAGAFYGVQSFRQLLPAEQYATKTTLHSAVAIPAVNIKDKPRFEWRGGLLDAGRYFMPASFVKKYIDLLAMHKYNRFHWHLTDDQGWRIEIKKYPKLTEIGSRRTNSALKHGSTPKMSDESHEGFYTQKELKDIVAYAKERHVMVIPEVSFPGHSQAAIASYPWLGNLLDTDGNPVQHPVRTKWGISNHILSPSEKTIQFFKDVLDELAEIFPAPYFHIGGDEAPLGEWENSVIAKRRMKELGFNDVHQLQSYLVNDLIAYLKRKGKSTVAWSDIVQPGLDDDLVIMPWRKEGHDDVNKTRKYNFQMVMTPVFPTYFDYIDNDDGWYTIGRANSLNQVYNFDPVKAYNLPENVAKRVKGSQFQCWTECMPESEIIERRVYPRAIAMAEVLWTPAILKDFGDFKKRLSIHSHRLINYGVRMPLPPQIVGSWQSSQIKSDFTQIEFDVTSLIKKSADYSFTFIWKSGKHGVDIKDVELFHNDQIVAKNAQAGFAGFRPKNNTHTLKVTDFKPGKYTLKAKLKGSGGTNSNGEIEVKVQ